MFKSDRRARSSRLVDPVETQRTLLKFHEEANYGLVSTPMPNERKGKSPGKEFIPFVSPFTYFLMTKSIKWYIAGKSMMATFDLPQQRAGSTCSGPGNRLCKTRYNTTAPLYGVSLTSGQPVTIVQKFPDLLQQVIFEVCE